MGTIASTRVYRNNPPLNTGEGLTILRNNQIGLRELIGSLPPATITSVSSNTITPTSTMLIINANATINTITSTVNLSGETTTDNAQAEQEFHDGAVIKIIATSGKTVTIGNSGNVQLLNNASSVTVSSTTPTVLTYNASTHKWVEHERVSELIGGVVGDLSKLETAAKNTLVAAINEVDSNTNTNATNHTTLLNAVGNIAKNGNNITEISSQITRTSIIAAINDIVSKIGLPLAGLTTSVKSSIIAAINSLVSGKADKTEVGTLSSLTTTTKTSAVAAINELKSTHDTEIGGLANLKTTNKDSVVSAINELNTGVVHTSGDETVAGNKTFSGTVDLTRTTDAGGTSTNKPALRIGSLSGKHLEFDGDEIMAKNTGNTVGQLNINLDGGLVKIGNGGLTVTGTITGNVTGDLTGTASNATNDVDGNAIKTTYAKLASPTFTGTPKAPTASASTNNTQIATTAFVKTAISNLVNSAPTTLDTLNEIATALGNDPNFATTMATQLGLKANDADVVHKTGNEEIAGEKSFSANTFLKHNSIEHAAIPASDSYRGLYFTDKNDATLARIMYYKNATGLTGLSLGVRANNGTDYLAGLSIAATTDGEVWAATSSSPALDDNSNKIATTAWIRSATGNTTLNAATATKATQATQDEDGNTIKTTYAKLASPTFTGTPKAPTASASTNNTQIATTAFVKTAISDKANDSDVVHKTGDETVSGTKTFNSNNYFSISGETPLAFSKTSFNKGDILTNTQYVYLRFGGATQPVNNTTSLGAVGIAVYPTYARTSMLAFKNAANTSSSTAISVIYPNDGSPYAIAPNTPPTGTTSDIVTRDYADAIDTNAVHTTGNEEISGVKTHKNHIVISENASVMTLQMTDLDTTVTSTANKIHSAIAFNDKNDISRKNRTAVIQSGMSATDSNFISLIAYDPTENSAAYNGLSVWYPRGGTAYTSCITPSSASDDSNKIATTEWVRDATGNFACNAATATKATQDENGRNIASGYMWRNSYERIAGTSTAHKDLNDYTNAGFYNIATQYVDNVPAGIGTYAVLLVYPWKPTAGDGTFCSSQEITEAYSSANCRRWIRKQNNGVWSEWKLLAFNENVVHITGNETIAGTKTFSSTIAGSINGNAATATKATQDEDGNTIKTTYAKLASPTFTGTPKAPTASASTNNTQIATTAFVKTAISNLVNSAPTTLDTLNEIATALGNDPNFATTMTTQLGLKANDSDVVHKTGDETVAGEKTLSGNTTISKSSPVLSLQMLNLDTTQVSTSNKYYSAIGFCDKNGIDIKNRTGMIRSGISNVDSNFVEICAINPTENSLASAHLSIHYARDGHAKAVAPSTLTADDVVNSTMSIADTDIITRDFIPKDTRIVHTTDNEEIDGIKTFKKDIYLIDSSPSIIARVSNTTKGTLPSTTIANGVSWYDGSGTTSNTTRYGGISNTVYNSGSTSTRLLAFKNEAGSGAYAELSVNYPLNESAYGTAPSTPQTGRTTDIITRDYLDYHKVEKTAWSIVPIFSVTLNEAVTATLSSPKQYGVSDFGAGYKELFIQLYHATAQHAAATLRYRIIFTDDKSILGQVNSALTTSAKTYTSIRAVNDNGLAFTMAGAAAGDPNRFAWYSLSGEGGAPSFCNVDATIKTFRLWSITSAVTQLPAGLKITIWGRK